MIVVRLRLAVRRLCVAIDAGCVRIIRAVDMAVAANGTLMRQSPVLSVIKYRAEPICRRVAGSAGRRKRGCDVIGHVATERNRALPRGGMATVAIGREIAGIVVIDVTSGAGRFRGIGVGSG
jgi:hypothetical protein